MRDITADKAAYDLAVLQLDTSIKQFARQAIIDATEILPCATPSVAAEILAIPGLRDLSHEELYEYAVIQTGVAVRLARFLARIPASAQAMGAV